MAQKMRNTFARKYAAPARTPPTCPAVSVLPPCKFAEPCQKTLCAMTIVDLTRSYTDEYASYKNSPLTQSHAGMGTTANK